MLICGNPDILWKLWKYLSPKQSDKQLISLQMSPPQFLRYEDCLTAESQGFEGAQEVIWTPTTYVVWAWTPGNLQFLGRWAWMPALSRFGHLGVLHGGRNPSRAFQVFSRAANPSFSGLLRVLCSMDQKPLKALRIRFVQRNPRKVILWNPQPDMFIES